MSQQEAKHEVPRATVAGAVSALTKWMRTRAAEAPPNLLTDERDDLVVLQLSLRKVPASPTAKPHLLPIPHPVVAHPGASVCLISDDRAASSGSPAASAILDAAKSLGLPVDKVIPFSELRTDYRPFEARRQLAASHDLFIADRALLPMLPRLIGKAFYSTKKAPIAVDFTRAGWPEQVRKVVSSTFLYLRSGTCSGIKVGRLDMEEDQIVENILAAVEAAVEKVPKKWANVRALHLKAVDSVALPIYQAVPVMGMKIDVPVGRLEGEAGAGEVIDAAQVESGRKKKDNKKKALKNVGADVAKEESGKRKRNKKVEDVVMEEAQGVTEKKRKKDGEAAVEVPGDEELKVSKKEKKKRALDKETKDATVEKKKGKKSENSLEESSSKKSEAKTANEKQLEDLRKALKEKLKGKKDDSKLALEEVEDVGSKKNKKAEIKVGKKKSVKGNSDDGEVLVDGENSPDAIEAKKTKGKKSSGGKTMQKKV